MSSTTTTANNNESCGPLGEVPLSTESNKNLIRLESVLQDLYRIIDANGDGFSQDDALESAASAAYHLYNYKFYETAICMQEIDNYKVTIPDYYSVIAVYYRPALDSETQDEMIEVVQKNLCDTGTGQLVETDAINIKKAVDIFKWRPMYSGHTIPAMARQLKGDGTISDGKAGMNICEYTYSLRGCNMTTSECNGTVMVIYRRVLRDDDGHLMIPNLAVVNEAIRTYVLMEMQLKAMLSHREGALSLYREMMALWEKQQAVARAKMMMPNLPEWISMINSTNQFIKNDPFERHFQTHQGREVIDFGTI